MARARVGLLVAASAVALLAGCGTAPSATTPAPVASGPPTAAVDAFGKPISSLCDLLAAKDFTELTGVTAPRTPAPVDLATKSATCDYGDNMTMRVQVADSVPAATTAYQATLKTGGFTQVKQGAIGGVDESTYGTVAGGGVMNVRRLKLVVSIVVPASGGDAEVKLVQLAARVLSRANALGT
jgi:hypothetical protein